MPKEELFENTEDILRKYYDRSRQLTIKILGAKMNADLKKKMYIYNQKVVGKIHEIVTLGREKRKINKNKLVVNFKGNALMEEILKEDRTELVKIFHAG